MQNPYLKKIGLSFSFIFILFSLCFAQFINTDKTIIVNSKKIFVNLGLDNTTQTIISKRGYSGVITIGVEPNIDKLTFNEELLLSKIAIQIPQKNSKAIVVLDWEGEALSILHDKDSSITEYKKVFDQFVSAYELVKTERPLVTCGFYGLPFRTYWKRDSLWIKKCINLKPLLSHFDALFPSDYVLYKDSIDVKGTDNINFVRDNVQIALRLSYELKKPSYIFIWHRYHDSNKKYGLELIPEKYFKDQIIAISQSKYKNKKPDGIIWWSAEIYYHNVLSKTKTVSDLKNYKFSDGKTTLRYLKIINENL